MSPNLPLPAQAGNPLEAKMGGGAEEEGEREEKGRGRGKIIIPGFGSPNS
jgi:hypothetical protein